MADQKTLDLLLREARSHSDFSDRPVPDEALRGARADEMGPDQRELPADAHPVPALARSVFYNPAAITWFKDKGAHTEVTAFRNGTLNIGYGSGNLLPRDLRFTFDQVCRII